MQSSVLFVPGLRGSAPRHWQTLWLAGNGGFRRVLHESLGSPRVDVWVAAVDEAIRGEAKRPLLVAHGFGCLAVLQRLARRRVDVAGAMLVAPRDPLEFGLEAAMPRSPLEMPTILVASRNDPWMSFESARVLATGLGSVLVDAGAAGHIDADSGYGPWPAGLRLLAELGIRARAWERELRTALALIA